LDRSSIEDIPGIKPVAVSAVMLDNLVSIMGFPALVKIDVEGHESSVLEGMSAIFSYDKKPILLFEALSRHDLDANLAVLNKHAQDRYLCFRIKPEGKLGSVDEIGTNNYLAVPQWAASRLQGGSISVSGAWAMHGR